MSDEVNTPFVLDMQRKLYRWSNENPDKVFADLFNLVCDRRILVESWRRLARNSGSRTPVAQRGSLRKSERRFATELTIPNLSGNGSSRSPANRGSSGHSAFQR